jgi:hypothetical protein
MREHGDLAVGVYITPSPSPDDDKTSSYAKQILAFIVLQPSCRAVAVPLDSKAAAHADSTGPQDGETKRSVLERRR